MRARMLLLVGLAGCASLKSTPPTVLGMTFAIAPLTIIDSPDLSAVDRESLRTQARQEVAAELTRRGLFAEGSGGAPDIAAVINVSMQLVQDGGLIYGDTRSYRIYAGHISLRFSTPDGKQESTSEDYFTETPGHFPPRIASFMAGSMINSDTVFNYSLTRRREAPVRESQQNGGRLAVLDLRSYVNGADVVYLSDEVRSIAFRSLPKTQVITRENILVLLAAAGKKIEDCDAECEVETGRQLGADTIISGDLHRIGHTWHLSLRMHATKSASLIGVAAAKATDLEQLDAALPSAMAELLKAAR